MAKYNPTKKRLGLVERNQYMICGTGIYRRRVFYRKVWVLNGDNVADVDFEKVKQKYNIRMMKELSDYLEKH